MRQVLSIACYETMCILKDKILLLMVFAVPLIYAVLFGLVYVQGILTGIPMGIVDMDNSSLSREVVQAFENSPRFKIVREIDTYPRLEEGMKNGAVRAGLVIPEDFEKRISQHRSVEVLTVYDGSNLIWGYNIRKYALEVINKFSADHAAARLAGMGMSGREVAGILDAVSCNIEVWYNPTFSYATFLLGGLMMMIIHQICLLSVSLSVTREKERNSWLMYLSSPVPGWKIFLGKCLPYFAANFLNYLLLIWLGAAVFHVKTGGSLLLIILLGLLYDIIITSAGVCVSALAPDSLQATRYLMLLSVPLFIISGYTWPPTHIPPLINGLARLLPYTWMAEGFRLVTVKELGFAYLAPAVLALFSMAMAAVLFAAIVAKRRRAPVIRAE